MLGGVVFVTSLLVSGASSMHAYLSLCIYFSIHYTAWFPVLMSVKWLRVFCVSSPG